jgi:hypothetical protein
MAASLAFIAALIDFIASLIANLRMEGELKQLV